MSLKSKDEIYSAYHDKVLWYIKGKVGDSYLAEDLCSEVFIKVMEKLDTFDEKKAAISTWIFTITRNTLIDYYRVRKVFVEIPEELENGSDIEDEIISKDTLEILANALEKLEERERDIIILRYYSNLTLKVIAERLNISYAYVKILHNKALAELKNLMAM